MGTYTMDGVSNGKGFYKKDENVDRYNDGRSVETYLGDRYLHYSSIFNSWMVNIGYWTLLLPKIEAHSRVMGLY